jgi:SOS-response transcriptional repressor LexA
MGHWQKNLKQILRYKNLTQEDLASRLGMTQGAIGHWLTGRRSIDVHKLQQIADALDTPIENLFSKAYQVREKPALYQVEQKAVPVISWEQAANWPNQNVGIDMDYEEKDSNRLMCPIAHSANAYAVELDNDSMQSAQSDSYPKGCVLFVEPNGISTSNTFVIKSDGIQSEAIQSGDAVIAKLKSNNRAIFKIFVEDANNQFLQSLNPDYPVINEPFILLGKVIGIWRES